jgi:hypothetical protein
LHLEESDLITSIFLWLVEGIGAKVMNKLMYTADKDIDIFINVFVFLKK